MKKSNNTFLVIFVTFVATSALYLGAHLVVPGIQNALNNVAQLITPGFDGGGKLGEVKGLIESNFIEETDQKKLETKAVKAYVSALDDPYSEYYTKDEFESLSAQLSGNYKGVGIEVSLNENNLITVITAYKNAPAAKAGILSGDCITAVNGTKVNGDNYNKAINMIRGIGEYGKKGSVTLTIKRADEVFDVDVTREEITMETVESKMLSESIGYVNLSNFAEESHKDFELAVNSLISSGAKGLVIDLRNNPGGMLTTVVSIADYLLPKGVILTVKGRNTPPEVFYSDESAIDIPMCVLINGASASASEVLAGALRDHKKATLVGEKTFGKGVVQTVYDLTEGDALKITTAKYYTPNDICIDGKGIKPDHEIKPEADSSTDVQLNKAIEILTK